MTLDNARLRCQEQHSCKINMNATIKFPGVLLRVGRYMIAGVWKERSAFLSKVRPA